MLLSIYIKASGKSGKQKKNKNNLPIIFYLSSLHQKKTKLPSVVFFPILLPLNVSACKLHGNDREMDSYVQIPDLQSYINLY